jgi:hypothetical protein
LAEVLIGPYKRGDEKLAERIREAFDSPAIETLPFTAQTTDTDARIRDRFGFSPPHAKTDVFLTNDENLVRKGVPGIQFVAKVDTDLF